MATLDPFAGPHTGPMAIFVYGWIGNYVGSGSFTVFDSFRAVFSGTYDYLGFSGDVNVSLELTDNDPNAQSGPCTVTLLGNTDTNASYQVNGEDLTITTSLNPAPFNIYSYKGGTEFDYLCIPEPVGCVGIWIGPDSSDPTGSEQQLAAGVLKLEQQALRVKETFEAGLMRLPFVHGVSLGYKCVEGRATSQPAICLHVSRKVPADVLMPSERIPPNIEGVPTDVIEHLQVFPLPGLDSGPTAEPRRLY